MSYAFSLVMSIFNFSAVSMGGFVYGNSLRDSVINSLQTVWIQQAVNLMITAHCLSIQENHFFNKFQASSQ